VTLFIYCWLTVDFKPRLEKLLADMVLVSEIADLAVEAAKLNEEEEMHPEKKSSTAKELAANMPRTMPTKGLWSSVKFDKNTASDGSEGEDEEEEEANQVPEEPPKKGFEKSSQKSDRPHLSRSPSGSILFKSRLDKWDEPQSKLDKVNFCYSSQCKRGKDGILLTNVACLSIW
jgi:hypothetical protein